MRMRLVVIGVLLAAGTAVTAVGTARFTMFGRGDAEGLAVTTAAAWALTGGAFVLGLRMRGRGALILLFAGALAMGGAGLVSTPNLSTDSARYAWDGIVQDAGISPYAHTPAAAALTPLRPEWLFPRPVRGSDGRPECIGERIETTTVQPGGGLLCTAINRPHVPTIYPPVAEAYFALVRALVPTTARYLPLQVAGLVLSLGTTALLAAALLARAVSPLWAAVWGWSPFVTAQAVNNSHIDALGVVFILAASLLAAPAAARWRLPAGLRPWLVGAAVGLAAAVKFVPAIGAPPLARRHPVRVLSAAVATFALVYLPYVLVSGGSVIGFLPGYLSQEGYDNGSRFVLLSLLVHGPAATVVGAVLVLIAVLAAYRFADPAAPWHAQVILTGTVLLIVSPHYPWYALVLVPFVALSGRWEWLAVPLALTAAALFPHLWVSRPAFATAAALVIVLSLVRWRRGRTLSSPIARQRTLTRISTGEERP